MTFGQIIFTSRSQIIIIAILVLLEKQDHICAPLFFQYDNGKGIIKIQN